MNLRSLFLTLASIANGIVLVASLVAVSKIDPRATMRQLGDLNRMAFVKLTLLMGLNTFLSAQKWRLVDAAVRRPADAALPRLTSFALTSAGVAIGQVLPTPVSMVAARTLGTYYLGNALTRGTLATIFDQGFDFLIACFLIPASGAMRFLHGGGRMWVALSAAMSLVALFAVGIAVRLLQRVTAYFAERKGVRPSGLQRGFARLQTSGFLNVNLARRLLMLSTLRFAVLVLMAGETTEALGSNVPLSHLAAAMPFVVISSALPVTPGGLGVNELTYAATLSYLGTPLHAAAQWALANRLLVAAASFAVAVGTAGILFAVRSCKRFGSKVL